MSGTLKVTSITTFTQNYLSRNSGTINSIAQRLGVPATAIASAIAEEMRNVYTEIPVVAPDGNVPLDELGIPIAAPAKNIIDALADWRVANSFSNEDIATDFQARLSDILAGNPPSILEKYFSPTANDIGPANINLRIAILTLQRYLADDANETDPLNLQQYANNYSKPVGRTSAA